MDQTTSTHTYGQYCPITRALDVLGDRWCLLIVRDLICGTTRFNDLARGLPGLSRSLLAKRLRQLERHGVLDHVRENYLLTEAGRELEPVVFAIGGWGAPGAFDDPRDAERDAELLVWSMHSRLDTSELPGDRHVVSMRFTDDPRDFWIVLERGTPSVCLSDPGYPVDLAIGGSVSTLYRVWLGAESLTHAIKPGTVTVEGSRAWTRRVTTIMQLSPIASIVTEQRSRS